jgi:ribosomal protein S27AE
VDISKKDFFRMTPQQVAAGKRAWEKTGQVGRLAHSSFDAESRAPKTWILYANSKGEEIKTIECELYTVGRRSDPSEGVVMVNGMCPNCGETFIATEDNKTMTVERVRYRQAPRHIRVNWRYHCEKVLGRRFSEDDVVFVVSSPERWACDYCKSWCVKVSAGVAIDDLRGVTQVVVPYGTAVIAPGQTKSTVEF